jgi:hypothetical protein
MLLTFLENCSMSVGARLASSLCFRSREIAFVALTFIQVYSEYSLLFCDTIILPHVGGVTVAALFPESEFFFLSEGYGSYP